MTEENQDVCVGCGERDAAPREVFCAECSASIAQHLMRQRVKSPDYARAAEYLEAAGKSSRSAAIDKAFSEAAKLLRERAEDPFGVDHYKALYAEQVKLLAASAKAVDKLDAALRTSAAEARKWKDLCAEHSETIAELAKERDRLEARLAQRVDELAAVTIDPVLRAMRVVVVKDQRGKPPPTPPPKLPPPVGPGPITDDDY